MKLILCMFKFYLLILFSYNLILLSNKILVASDQNIIVTKDLSHTSAKLGPYKAFIIGINDYQDSRIDDLHTAVKDAKEMATLLKIKYGFTVDLILEQQATKASIVKKLRKLVITTSPDDSILIYYAGHGDIDRVFNDGWWIPWDAKAGESITYIDNTIVQKALRAMPARHVLLISDSCYSGMLFGQSRALPSLITDKYYLSLYNEKSRWGITSGNKNPVSDTGSKGHSVFAYQLLKVLSENTKLYISTQEIYNQIAPVIGNNSEQVPLCRPIRNTNDQGGEFIFVISNIITPLLRKQKSLSPKFTQTNLDKESIFWQSIQNSNNHLAYQAYINKFPRGTYTVLARIKINELKSKNYSNPKSTIDDAKIAFQDNPKIALKTGSLSVKTQPSPASIYVNEAYEGESPIELKGIQVGKIIISAKKYGFKKSLQSVNIKPGEREALNLFLEKEVINTKGKLYIKPEDAKIRILNIDENFYQGISLLPGRYKLEVQKTGYQIATKWVHIKPGDNKTINIHLKKIETFTNEWGMTFVKIPPGKFIMGDSCYNKFFCYSDLHDEQEQKSHPVEIEFSYYIQTTELTQGQWKAVMNNNLWNWFSGNNPSFFNNCGDNCPVENVSWDDVKSFIYRLNSFDRDRLNSLYSSSYRYRLPSEAQWEYAARAKTTECFFWGNKNDCSYANCRGSYGYSSNCSSSIEKTKAVMSYYSNSWGLYDMHGNVRELCNDEYTRTILTHFYYKNQLPHRTESKDVIYHITRGGSWNDRIDCCGSGNNTFFGSDERSNEVGFRLVISP